MKPLLEFTFPCLPPSVNKMYSRSKDGVFKTAVTRRFERRIVKFFPKRPHYEGPLALFLEFHTRTNRKYTARDVDNFLKCTLDGLQLAGQIRNDREVVLLADMKIPDTKNFIHGYLYKIHELQPTIFSALKPFVYNV